MATRATYQGLSIPPRERIKRQLTPSPAPQIDGAHFGARSSDVTVDIGYCGALVLAECRAQDFVWVARCLVNAAARHASNHTRLQCFPEAGTGFGHVFRITVGNQVLAPLPSTQNPTPQAPHRPILYTSPQPPS